MKNIKENLLEVANYFIKEWLIFLIVFGIIGLIFKEVQLIAWAMLGRLLGIVFFDKQYDR